MVEKKRRIARKPSTPPPEADRWIEQGGVDPEATKPTEPTPAPAPKEPEPEPAKDEAKTYPHRISFDMETAQYKRLKWASFDSDRSMNEILREAVEDWMKARDY